MFQSRLPKITAGLLIRAETIAHEGADLIAERAKSRVPVDTGRLRDAIHVERSGAGEFTVVAGDTEAFYGHIVEHGGVRTPAHPFLIPALEESRGEVMSAAAALLRSL